MAHFSVPWRIPLECVLCLQNPLAKPACAPGGASECTTNRITINKTNTEFLKPVNTCFPARGTRPFIRVLAGDSGYKEHLCQ